MSVRIDVVVNSLRIQKAWKPSKGVGKATTESTTKSNVTVSGDLIEYDALGGLERSVSREQGSLLQTIGKLIDQL